MNGQPGLWDSVSTGLGIGASAAGLIAAIWGFVFVVRRWWDHTVGRRRAQAAILDQLTCTSSLAFVESKLGVPQFITHLDGYEERIYRLPGAWVTVQPVDGAVRAFSITITDPSMYYEAKGMTFGVVDLRLGKDTFEKAQPSGDEQLAIGARHVTYMRHYEANNPSGFQEYWLAYNVVGSGGCGGEPYGSGVYKGVDGTYGGPPDPAGITANTLTVLAPEGDRDRVDHMHKRTAHGPHMEQLRLLWTERDRLYR